MLIIRLRNVPFIDATAVHALNLLHDNCQRSNTTLILSEVNDSPYKVIKRVGRLRNVPFIDATAVHALNLLHDNCQRSNTTLILSEVNDSPYKVIKRVGLVCEIGRAQVCRQFDQAIDRAKQLIQTV